MHYKHPIKDDNRESQAANNEEVTTVTKVTPGTPDSTFPVGHKAIETPSAPNSATSAEHAMEGMCMKIVPRVLVQHAN